MRINKHLAAQGYSSRRAADELIKQGRVRINGRVAQLGDQVNETDKVLVNQPERQLIYLAYHKPRGLQTEKIRPPAPGVFPIGRLDKESEGLIILTNDGRLTTHLIAPKNQVEKEYVVTVDKKLDGLDLKRMQATRLSERVCRLILTEGHKHQIRRLCAGLGYQVRELKRVRVGPWRLGNLPPGASRAIIVSEFRN